MMDIVNSYIGMQNSATMAQVQMAVAKKALDSQRLQGDGVLQLLEAASTGFAKATDQLTVAATGLGGNIDVRG